ncbi:MAG: transglutaminase family protein [Proteobacteria bacterium]|nr:transglutaminase family protein [Pseudomonadota bacterium]
MPQAQPGPTVATMRSGRTLGCSGGEDEVHIRFGFEISIECQTQVTLLLALSPHRTFSGRRIGSDDIRTSPAVPLDLHTNLFGNRIVRLLAPQPGLTVRSDCIAEVAGEPDIVAPDAPQIAIADLPTHALPFLTASRYCESDELTEVAWQNFGQTKPGWDRVQAICDFIHERTTFDYKFGRPTKTAREVYEEKTGVCRDFAHLAVSLCRAMNIPARYASGYLGDIGIPPTGPGDFCAWFEAFLGGRWYTFDARYNTPRIGRILMVRGRDAADTAMITSFGAYTLTEFRVWTDEVPSGIDEKQMLEMLKTPPDAEARVSRPAARMAS